ncbi:MAG: TauD/TfdA family dioxygenase, partial [Oceanospirillales bacterium]|nr:TauD/TfdA family dioxygenase [Oceanospirillales bacterium]
IYRALDPRITRSFAERELLYVRNYGNGLDLPWQQVFGTEERAEVEAFCQAQSIELQWLDGDGLRTRQRCPGIMLHPITGAPLWFNQAHLFHVSALEQEMREVLIDSVGEEYLPRNTYFGDGSTIPDAMLDEIRAVLDAHSRVFEWHQGDLLLLDNMRYAHARQPFSGKREILVAMAEEYRL